jgi:arsenite methyltransferase
MIRRFLARQFARPSGPAAALIGRWLDRIAGPSNRLALAEMRIGPGDDVLEIGFGGGALLGHLLNATRGTVFGVDLSPEMVERARRRFRGPPNLRLHCASVESLPLETASVDKAVSVASLYFWPDPAAALADMARVLRPGGTLSLVFEPPEELAKWPGSRFGFRAYDAAELEGLMTHAGFGAFRVAEGRGRKPDRFLCLTGTLCASEAAS